MDCLEFRRELATRPNDLGVEAKRHRLSCPTCAEAWQRAQVFEQRLVHAMAVPVPDALAERILLRQTTQVRQASRFTWAGLAAGLVMTVGMAGVGFLALRSPDTLASASIAHLAHEPFALNKTALIPSSEVGRVFAELGVPLRASLTQLTYLTRCPLGGKSSLHMVVREQDQPITVMYVPEQHQGSADFEDQGIVGRHRDVGRGTLVLLAERSGKVDIQAFDRIEATFRMAIEGPELRAGMD